MVLLAQLTKDYQAAASGGLSDDDLYRLMNSEADAAALKPIPDDKDVTLQVSWGGSLSDGVDSDWDPNAWYTSHRSITPWCFDYDFVLISEKVWKI